MVGDGHAEFGVRGGLDRGVRLGERSGDVAQAGDHGLHVVYGELAGWSAGDVRCRGRRNDLGGRAQNRPTVPATTPCTASLSRKAARRGVEGARGNVMHDSRIPV